MALENPNKIIHSSFKELNFVDHITWMLVDPLLNETERISTILMGSDFKNRSSIAIYKNPDDLRRLVKQNDIVYSYNYRYYTSIIHSMLCQELFDDILTVWNEAGSLRDVCFQRDWYGFNANSSLAHTDVDSIQELTASQAEFVDNFMSNIFLPAKFDSNINTINRSYPYTQISSNQELQQLCKSSKPICVIPLQCREDPTLTKYSASQFWNRKWAFQFAEQHNEIFFIMADHPQQYIERFIEISQNSIEDLPQSTVGNNWLYLPPDHQYDSQTLCMHADLVCTINCTMGFESLYWTPVVVVGKSMYGHPSISYGIKEFGSELPPKKKSDIAKYLYYAIHYYHFTPGINANSFQEWIEVSKRLKQNIGRNFIPMDLI